MMNSLENSIWLEAVCVLNPNLDVDDDRCLIARRHIENARWILNADHRKKTSGFDFEEYAQTGEKFLKGCLALQQSVQYVESFMPLENCYKVLPSMFADDFLIEMKLAIDSFRDYAKREKQLLPSISSKREGRNSKPHLHDAMFIAYKLWLELSDDKLSSYSRFLKFASLCFDGCRGVTSHSLRDSLRRHVIPVCQVDDRVLAE